MIKNLKETDTGMTSANHVDRLVAEFDQLQFRLSGLYDVLKKYATHQLDHPLDCDIEILRQQADAMEVYLDCLAERICNYADDCDCEGCDHAN